MNQPSQDGFTVQDTGPIQAAEDLTAAIYARTSSTQQKHGYSIDEQVRQCWNRCEELNWTISHIFRDEEVSGKDTDREMFQKLLSRAEDGWFDVILVWKLDRFSRSLMHAVQLERKLRRWDVGLHSITEQIDTTTPTGRFNFRSISSASELERDLIKQRSKMGLRALAQEYKWPNNNPPIGYELRSDGKLTIKSDEEALIHHIFDRYIELKSMPDLADELEGRDGVIDREVNWTPHKIGKILKNEIYIGQYSISDVEEYVEEYQILTENKFQKATEVRTRFQSDGKSSRPEMPTGRKKRRIKNIIQQYSSFLGQSTETE